MQILIEKVGDQVAAQIEGHDFLPTMTLRSGIAVAAFYEVQKFKITDEEIEGVVQLFIEIFKEKIEKPGDLMQNLYDCPPVKWINILLDQIDSECDRRDVDLPVEQRCWVALQMLWIIRLDEPDDELSEDDAITIIKRHLKDDWDKELKGWKKGFMDKPTNESNRYKKLHFDCIMTQYDRRDRISESELEKMFFERAEISRSAVKSVAPDADEDFILKIAKEGFLEENSYSNLDSEMVDRFIAKYKKRGEE